MSKVNGRKLILLTYDKSIEYDNSKVFIDGQEDQNLGSAVAEEYAYEKTREYYKRFFSTHSENFIVLTGAGSSVGIGRNGKKGKTRAELWESVKNTVAEKSLKELCGKIKYDYPDGTDAGDIEAILSKAEKAKEYVADITDVVKKIKDHIKTVCSLKIPDAAPHQLFIQKITSRKLRDPRVKIFTLNYDTLFEQAARDGVIVIDGFSYENPRSFNGVNFDYDFVIRENSRIEREENYVPRVVHIYKLHGSLDWERKDTEIIKTKEEEVKDPLIIYPNYEKYEVSYEQPFFEMMLRFQQVLRRENVTLLVIGFSFYDKHITAIVKEALKTNPNFRMVIITKDLSQITGFEEFRVNIRGGNLVMIDETFEEFVKHYPFPQVYQSDLLKSEPKEKAKS